MQAEAIVQLMQTNIELLITLLAWSLIWKAVALWHAARNSQLAWYIALVVINTVGILEIVYLLFFRKKQSFSRYF